MEINYILTDNEKTCLSEIINFGGSYTHSSDYDQFRNKYKSELNQLKDKNILYHSNHLSEGAYIRYSLTQQGKDLVTILELK